MKAMPGCSQYPCRCQWQDIEHGYLERGLTLYFGGVYQIGDV